MCKVNLNKQMPHADEMLFCDFSGFERGGGVVKATSK